MEIIKLLKSENVSDLFYIACFDKFILTEFGLCNINSKHKIEEFSDISLAKKYYEKLLENNLKQGFYEIDNTESKKYFLDKLQMVKEVLKLSEDYNLNEYKAIIANFSKIAIKFTTTIKDKYKELGSTRFGGLPDLPPEIEYPDSPLYKDSFIAQINLKDISEFNTGLPKTGIFYFFEDGDGEDEYCKLFYYNDNFDRLKKFEFDKNTYKKNTDRVFKFDNGKCLYSYYAFLVSIEKIISIPDSSSFELGNLNFNQDEYDNYSNLKKNLEKRIEKKNFHLMFAYPISMDSDPRHNDENNVCIISFNYDHNTKFCFNDAGILNYVINKNDLLKKEFDKYYCEIQSS